MKKLLASLSCFCMVACTSVVDVQIVENTARCDRFVQQIDQGKTTRTEEQDFIKANRKAWWAINYSENNTPLPPDLASIASLTNSK